MNATTRTRRATLRTRATHTRATARAHRNIAPGTPQSARTHLIAAGIDPTTAKRYAGAFSRGLTADAARTTKIKLKGRTRKTTQIKLYTATTFAHRLATYRPRDITAARLFEQAAHRLAA
jgi:hypothetical protein